jgi:hypothetical protein
MVSQWCPNGVRMHLRGILLLHILPHLLMVMVMVIV